MINICASIITYNPDTITLQNNINALLSNNINNIIIFDNASINIKYIEDLLLKFNNMHTILIKNIQNKGIAFALNKCLKLAHELHFEWILTLDQDSILTLNYLNNMTCYIKEGVGLIAPEISDQNLLTQDQMHTSTTQSLFRHYIRNKRSILPMPITSGSLTNVEAAIICGGFNDCFFIDSVDYDLDLKLHEHGYKIIYASKAKLNHSLGHPKGHYFLKWYFTASGHPAWRYYYMSRNTWLIFYNHHKSSISSSWCWSTLLHSINPLLILYTIIANNWDMLYLKYIIIGNIDGIFKKKRCFNHINSMFNVKTQDNIKKY